MKNSNHRVTSVEATGDFFRNFLSLDRIHRRIVALRILRNQKLLGDLYDHFLIQKALLEGGRSVSWTAYRRSSKAFAT